jgi:hypothetical protein
MFVGDEVMLDIAFPAARSGLARLALAGLLHPAQEAFRYGSAVQERPVWPGPLALTQVQARPLARSRDRAGLAIRWQAAEPGSGPFSILDADLGLVPAGEPATWLTLAGSYRISPGVPDEAPDRAVLRQVAAATIRHFLSRVAADLTGQPGAGGPPRR